MKKLSIFGFAALLCTGLVACDNYEEPNALPQTNPQEPIFDGSQVSVTSAINAGTVYSLEQLSASATPVAVATVTAPDMAPNFTYTATAYMLANGKSFEMPAQIAPNADSTAYVVSVAPDDLQGIYFQNVSKGPKERTVQLEVALALKSTNASQEATIGGENHKYGPYDITLLPFPSSMVLEDNYYLVGTACDWTISKAIRLTPSYGEGGSVYDSPVFSAKFDIFEGWWWKIVPESTFVTGDWVDGPNSQFGPEVNGDESLSGILTANDPQAGCLNVTGPYTLTINMEEMTYEFSYALEQLYTPGNSNGWSQTASQILFTTDYANYTGYAYLNGEFKFSTQPDWNGTNYGSTGEEGTLSTDGGAGNLNSGSEGLFWVSVNIPALTYSLTPVTTYGVIGSATPAGWDASTALTPSADFLTWSGDVTLSEGEIKFRANDGWDLNLGGSYENLTPGGDNLPVAEAGTYTVTLYLGQLPYRATIVKK